MRYDDATRQQITDAVLMVAQILSMRRWWDIDGPKDWEICVGDARATVAAMRGDSLEDYVDSDIGAEFLGTDPSLDTTPLLRLLMADPNGEGSLDGIIASGIADTLIDEASRRGEAAVLPAHDYIRLTSHGLALVAQ